MMKKIVKVFNDWLPIALLFSAIGYVYLDSNLQKANLFLILFVSTSLSNRLYSLNRSIDYIWYFIKQGGKSDD
ncbi:hypothetical protein BBX37_08185 [Listeria monocytogenes]|nr:hypothetical protein [Listeria monocytogenes]